MISSTEQETIYETIGKLVFQSGLPQLLGLYPDHNLHAETDAQEAAAMLAGMLKAMTHGEHFDGHDLMQWKENNLQIT